MSANTTGTVAVLNVGDGDTKLSFDPKNPAERIRAARIVRDMLRRGYALLIEVERDGQKVFQRATDFHEDVCEYVIADLDPITAAEADTKDTHGHHQVEPGAATPAGKVGAAPKQRGRKPTVRTIPAASARAVVVAPVAGG